ncbi:MAG: DUF3467 domain-containing protein [Bacteroidetes bacterium]|nr:MAG: DUF3467 domain-containing protein [Bacteroidota bacterium]
MADQPIKKEGQQLSIELPATVAHGVYSNMAVVSHSNTEFVLDFIQVIPGTPKAEVRSRVIMTPENAKRFLAAMTENIEKYERMHGELPTFERGDPVPPNFGGPAGFA